jgi:hypothetical protein
MRTYYCQWRRWVCRPGRWMPGALAAPEQFRRSHRKMTCCVGTWQQVLRTLLPNPPANPDASVLRFSSSFLYVRWSVLAAAAGGIPAGWGPSSPRSWYCCRVGTAAAAPSAALSPCGSVQLLLRLHLRLLLKLLL